MLCFDFATTRPHNCIPVTADWDIGIVYRGWEKQGVYPGYRARQKAEKEYREGLDAMIKQAEAVMPITAQAGVMSWGRALGMV